MTIFETRTAILLSFLCATGLGCVTQGTFDELATELDVLRTENAQLSEKLAALEEENQGLGERLSDAERELTASKLDLQSLGQTHEQLVSELRSEVESGQVQIRKVLNGVSVGVSDELLFASGSARLSDAGRDVLRRVADRIQGDSTLVFVEGHTDDVQVGKALRDRYPTNWELGGARAASVVRVLSETGVDPKRLRAVSRGPFDPIAPNDSEEGRAKNRRTEIILRPMLR